MKIRAGHHSPKMLTSGSSVQRALAPLLAKYLPPELLSNISTPTHHSPRYTNPRPTANTNPKNPSTHKPPIADKDLTTMIDQTSVDFEDQLSLASLEYMKRHQLDHASSSTGGNVSPVGSQAHHHQNQNRADYPGDNRGPLGRTMGAARGEQTTRILNVESIRRLPKLR